jgi:RNA polymerase sigma factor (sigma-70 family)
MKRAMRILDANNVQNPINQRDVEELRERSNDHEETAEKEEARQKVNRLLRKLSEREQIILKLRSEGMTLSRVGEKFGLTRERIRQIETGAINTLREGFGLPPKKHIYHETD